jgi:tagatose-1,6-bisphosphate aldolase non-catalytic subunit AgaZ/GatZ
LSDRIRYYWNHQDAEAAVARLFDILRGANVPATLMRQHLPAFEQFAGSAFDPETLAVSAVQRCLDDYRFAVTCEHV